MVFRKFYIAHHNKAVIVKETKESPYIVIGFNCLGSEIERVCADTFSQARKSLKPMICRFFKDLRELCVSVAIAHEEFVPYLTEEELEMRARHLEDRANAKTYSLADCMVIHNG